MLETTVPAMLPEYNLYPGENYQMIRGMDTLIAEKASPFVSSLMMPPPRGMEQIIRG